MVVIIDGTLVALSHLGGQPDRPEMLALLQSLTPGPF
jgi:hypothetical protein